MTIGGALVLVAAGAILKLAVTAHLSWIELQTTGTVLFIVGLAGLAVAVMYTFWLADRSRAGETRVMRPPQAPPPPPR
jgi:hypothetical protein